MHTQALRLACRELQHDVRTLTGRLTSQREHLDKQQQALKAVHDAAQAARTECEALETLLNTQVQQEEQRVQADIHVLSLQLTNHRAMLHDVQHALRQEGEKRCGFSWLLDCPETA